MDLDKVAESILLIIAPEGKHPAQSRSAGVHRTPSIFIKEGQASVLPSIFRLGRIMPSTIPQFNDSRAHQCSKVLLYPL